MPHEDDQPWLHHDFLMVDVVVVRLKQLCVMGGACGIGNFFEGGKAGEMEG